MPATKQVIRRVESKSLVDFDDQLWPVNVLLLILAGFIAGLILAEPDFETQVVWENAWVRLAALGISVLLIFVGALLLKRRFQRRMQIAVLVSLLLHLSLSLGMREYFLPMMQGPEDSLAKVEELPPVLLPDYHPEDTVEVFETPLETKTPDLKDPEVKRVKTPEPVVEKQPTAQPKLEPKPEPKPVEMERVEVAAPKQSEKLAGPQLTRRETDQRQPMPLEKAPEQQVKPQPKVELIETPLNQPQRSEPTPLVAQRPTREAQQQPTPALTQQQLERRQATDQPQDRAIAKLTRAETNKPDLTTQPLDSPQQREAMQSQKMLEQIDAQVREPQHEPSRVVGAPEKRTSEPTANATTPSDKPATTQAARMQDSPQPTQTAAAFTPRNARSPATAASADAEPVQSMNTKAANEPSPLEAPASPLARTAATSASATRQPSVSADLGQSGDLSIAATSTPRRADTAAGNVTTTTASDSRLASRTAGGAASSAPTVLADQATVGTASAAQATTPQPFADARPKATGGAPGLTRSASFDTGLPAAATTPVAGAAARRAEAMQESAAGADAAPSRPAQIARSRAGADAPSAALPTSDGMTPEVAGSRAPGQLEASSSAAVSRSASQAPAGAMTAAVGESSVDTGAPAISSTIGDGRTSGGGEAAPSASAGPRTLARSSAGVGSPGAAVVGPGPAMPAIPGQSGSGAPGASLTPAVAGPTRGGASGGAGSMGQPTPAAMSGGGASGGATGAVDALASTVGATGGGPRRAGSGDETPGTPSSGLGGVLGRRSLGGGPNFSAEMAAPSGGMAAPGPTAGPRAGSKFAGPLQPASDAGVGSRPSAGMPVRVAATTGPGGLGPDVAPELGVPNRRARPESEIVHIDTNRFVREKTGGAAAPDARVRDVAVPGLKQRDREGREDIAKSRGGSAGTERAVEMGLDFLARHQATDGSWRLHDFASGRGYTNAGESKMQSSTAGTGLALLAFLGAGYTHTDGKYRSVVERGLAYLSQNQKADGDLFVPQDNASNQNVWLYSHGIASIALCEAYGMTRDKELQPSAQKALNFIVYAQEPNEGGWRYSPQRGSDTSVSGWQVMALKSGELAGLTVSKDTYAKVTSWLDHAMGAGGDPSRYAYRPRATQAHQREPSQVMTAEALLMRQYLGWKRDNANMIHGADWLRENPPQFGQITRSQPSGRRDAYYWYYATQVMFQMQGAYWEDWNSRLRELLVGSQEQAGGLAGSWDPRGPLPDRWGEEGGRIYVTAMHLLMLEVYYRHLPIYQTLDEDAPAAK